MKLNAISKHIPSVLWHWGTMGPYHFARMKALAEHSPDLQLSVLENSALDSHGWERVRADYPFSLASLTERCVSDLPRGRLRSLIVGALKRLKPNLIVTTGLHDVVAHGAYTAYRRVNPDVMLVLWSESTEHDHNRHAFRELFKKSIAARHSGAIAAGEVHADYLRKLGFCSRSIAVSGDCVDNEYFRASARQAKLDLAQRERLGLSGRYFLYVGRLSPEKNLSRLIAAYKRYRVMQRGTPPELVLVGDGPDRPELESQVRASDIPCVTFVGTRQLSDLPHFYANCEALILPSIREPWGLVVNESMACGRPCLVSTRCGCVGDLIVEGVTGLTFDPFDIEQIASALHRFTNDCDGEMMGREADARVERVSLRRFATTVAAYLNRIRAESSGNPSSSNLKGQNVINLIWSMKERVM
jgi:glycosyltransferase involved in cell wall biosynthesis